MELLILIAVVLLEALLIVYLWHMLEDWLYPDFEDDELAQMMPEVCATTEVLQELNAELKELFAKQAADRTEPCPVCGYMRMKGELTEPPLTRPGSDAIPVGGHWKVTWVDEAEEKWEVIWVDGPKTTSAPPQNWRNPWDITYTAMRGDDA